MGELVDNPIGRIINDYELKELLGSGGQAAVYLASHIDPDVQHEVAIKIFNAAQSQDSDFMHRIKNEAMVVARLDNQNVVPLYNYHRETSGEICLFMRLMRGGSLSKRLRENGPLSIDEILVMLTRIASALTAAHQQRIIHGDVKPDNILFDQQNNIYLSDFGLSRQIRSSSNTDGSNDAGGTFGYIAPEQLMGANPKPQADIFSLGITLYECLTAERPSSDNWYQINSQQLEIVLPSIRNRRPELSPSLDEVIAKATKRDPSQRYDEVLKFVQDVVQALRNSLPASTDYERKRRSNYLSLDTGKIIHDYYRIRDKPRIGSNSIVYRAVDTRSKQEVVIKIIDVEHAQNADFVLHFRREALGIKAFKHSNIVAIITHWFDEDGSLYLVMPYLSGGSLSDRLRENGPLTIKEFIQITRQLSQALAAAHQRNIIHHDIRPANVLFDDKNNAYLVDFGLPKQHGESSNRVPSNGIGTPGYVAPEQFKEGISEPQGDIFSLAITLYECLTDHHPFAADRYQYIYQDGEIKLPKLRTRRPDLPVELDTIMRKAMRRDPTQRYDNALSFSETFIDALEKAPTLRKNPLRKKPTGLIDNIRHGQRPRVFISYRRKSSFWLALVLYEKLQNHGIDVFVDREKLDSTIGTPFAETLFQEIETRDVFICLLADGTLTSEWVKKEIERAHELKKPMIPVFQETFTKADAEVEPHVQALLDNHGVYAIDKSINDIIPKLAKAIKGFAPHSGRQWKYIAAAAVLMIFLIPAMVVLGANMLPKPLVGTDISEVETKTATQDVSPIPQPTAAPPTPTIASNTIEDTPTEELQPTTMPLPTDTPFQVVVLPTATLEPATDVPSATPVTPTFTETMTLTPTLEPVTTLPADTPIPAATLIPASARGVIPLHVSPSHFVVNMEVLSMAAGCSDTNGGKPCIDHSFYIGLHTVTNKQYRICERDAHICPVPANPSKFYNDLTQDERPVVNVTWKMAHQFCTSIGGRLPTEDEWAYAAVVIPDMGKPLDEWVGTIFEPVPNKDDVSGVQDTTIMVIRGDSANQGVGRLTQRDGELANLPNPAHGFRCAFSVDAANPG
jgi:serine/threonine protein kinase